MKINFAKIRSQAETLARRLMEDAELKGSRILGRNPLELEQNERALREEIQKAEQSLEDRKDARFDPDRLKGYLNDFTRLYEKMPLEQEVEPRALFRDSLSSNGERIKAKSRSRSAVTALCSGPGRT